MRNQPAGCRQHDLLVRAASAIEENRIPPTIRAEVKVLLTRLMAECLVADPAQPIEAGDE